MNLTPSSKASTELLLIDESGQPTIFSGIFTNSTGHWLKESGLRTKTRTHLEECISNFLASPFDYSFCVRGSCRRYSTGRLVLGGEVRRSFRGPTGALGPLELEKLSGWEPGDYCSMVAVQSSGKRLCAVTKDGVLIFQSNAYSLRKYEELTGRLDIPGKVISACMGETFTAILTDDGLVRVAGSNSHYCLGRGPGSDIRKRSTTFEIVDSLSEVEEISCGDRFVAALSRGVVWTWGKPTVGSGLLGLGRCGGEWDVPGKIDYAGERGLIIRLTCSDCLGMALTGRGVIIFWGFESSHNSIPSYIYVDIPREFSTPVSIFSCPHLLGMVDHDGRLCIWNAGTLYNKTNEGNLCHLDFAEFASSQECRLVVTDRRFLLPVPGNGKRDVIGLFLLSLVASMISVRVDKRKKTRDHIPI